MLCLGQMFGLFLSGLELLFCHGVSLLVLRGTLLLKCFM